MTAATGRRPAPTPIWWENETPVWDPKLLTGAQREGLACVICEQRWPRPRLTVGIVPDGTKVRACRGCAPLLRPARISAGGAVRAAAKLVAAGLVGHADLPAAVKEATLHLSTEACAAGTCRLCQAEQLAVVEIASHVQRTELLDGDPVDSDLERATTVLHVWRDAQDPPRAVVVEVLRAVAREFDHL